MRPAMLILTIAATSLTWAAGTEPMAQAAASPVAAAFGNTILSTYPDGRTAEIWLSPDGTYTGEGRRHDPSNGRWTVRGGRLCFKQSRPFVFGATRCFPLPAGGFDSPWAGKAPTGETTRIQVKPGHVVG
jgi:hypothetical protein